jgi:diguanylate cyclase
VTESDPVDAVSGVAAGATSAEANRRDSAASDRDHVSEDRDVAAQDRDVEATSRDNFATDRDGSTGHVDFDAASDREAAEGDRLSAASDRQHAADDRDAAAVDRSLGAEYSESLLYDFLTGVYRRRGGLDELGRDIAKSRRNEEPFVLAFIDVDRLREANDAGGHDFGDRLLVRVAAAIRGVVREYDVIVRYGGDEFLCGISGMDLSSARARFDQLNPVLATMGGGSATAGVVQLKAGEDLQHLIARADAAMYERKKFKP